MEKKGNMNTRKEIKNMLPEKREWYAYSKDIKFNTHQYLENCYTQGRNDVLSVTANLLIDRVAKGEDIKIFFNKFREEYGFEPERDDDLRLALQKEFVILKREVK